MHFGTNKVISKGNEYSWIFSARFMREKKKNMHFGSLIMSFESFVDITKKAPSLGSLIAFIEINNLFVMKNHILMDL